MVKASSILIEPERTRTPESDSARQHLLQRHVHRGRMAVSIGRGIAHELRNVAQLVGMLRDAMQHKHDMPAQLLDAVSLADTTLMRHISTLERLPPNPDHILPIALADVVDRTIELMRRRRRGPKMTFTVEVSRQLPVVMAIEADLDEILWELLTNSSEAASDRGQCTVHMRAEASDDSVSLIVEDDGVGITEAMRESLFKPFATSHASEEHLGLGLATAQWLAEKNGGTLEADLRVAAGTRFVLRLPRFHQG